MTDALKSIIGTTKRLAEMDPQDEAVSRTVQGLEAQIAQLTSEVEKPAGEKNSFGKASREWDIERLRDQVSRLKSAAMVPAANYRRIVSMLGELQHVVDAAAKPQNAAVRPKIAALVETLAGAFSEVDLVSDLENKSLEQVESAVHSLYSGGKQNSPNTYNFEARGKGHHTKSK